ncbi:MAG: RnfH family protein [Leptothrix sp. (in: b-proteobacteria)]
MPPTPAPLRVRIAYSPAARQVDVRQLSLAPGSLLRDALAASGLLDDHAALAAAVAAGALLAGIWGQRAEPTTRLHDGDRIELYRALTVDPKEARRQRYRAQGYRGRMARAGVKR